jgi:protein-S-isoprenylcysteine O-methyltransferase Ste14
LSHNGRLSQMSRTDHITILVVALLGLVGVAAIEVLTLLDVQEWIKFAVAVVTFAVILSGTYWFVLAQGDRRNGRGR